MARERLTQKTAETLLSKPGTSVEDKGSGIANDPYTMNNPEHEKNDPNKDEYVIGDPSKFGEDVNKDGLWKKDDSSRDPKTNHPSKGEVAKSAAEAVKKAKLVEERAIKCIIASQRILPGAPDSVVEEQATDLMYLPLQAINAMLTRQEKLAKMISAAADAAKEECEEEGEKEEGKKEEDESKEAGKKGEMPAGFAAMMEAKKDKSEDKDDSKDEAKEAKKEDKKDPMEEMEEKLAAMTAEFQKMKSSKGKKTEDDEEEESCDKDAGQNQPKDFYGKGLSQKEQTEGEKGKEVDAGDSLIDDIFNSVMASDEKKGAKALTGLVKKEASDNSGLNGVSLWGAPPDISQHFDTRS